MTIKLILVATYGDLDAAHTDFGELERRLKHQMNCARPPWSPAMSRVRRRW